MDNGPTPQIASDGLIASRTNLGGAKTLKEYQALFQRFFDAYTELGVMQLACDQSAIDRSTISRWRRENLHSFNDYYLEADEIINDKIRLEIRNRALVGSTTHEEVVTLDADGNTKSKRVRDLTFQTDTLLIFLAKSRMPEFRDRKELKVTIDTQTVDWLAQILVTRIQNVELLKQIMEDIDAGMANIIEAEFEVKALPGD